MGALADCGFEGWQRGVRGEFIKSGCNRRLVLGPLVGFQPTSRDLSPRGTPTWQKPFTDFGRIRRALVGLAPKKATFDPLLLRRKWYK